MGDAHITVLKQPAIDWLVHRDDGVYIDGTFGRGGHSEALLQQLGPQARVVAIDKDPAAHAFAAQHFAGETRLQMQRGSFADMRAMCQGLGIEGVSGVLLDLGVSSPQLDSAERGFSFSQDGPLDMRMDPDSGESAAEWIAHAEVEEITQVLKEYGEERFARRMAMAIAAQREQTPITTTAQLAKIVADANPRWEKHKHPATRAFQAIRIHINRELEDLERALEAALQVLEIHGRLVVISFHSLEDRLVKRFMRRQVEGDPVPRGVPLPESQRNRRFRYLAKNVRADQAEVEANPRARSAVLRAVEKVA